LFPGSPDFSQRPATAAARNPGYSIRLSGLCLYSLLLIFEIKIDRPFFQNLCSENIYSRFAKTTTSKSMLSHRIRSHSLHFSQQPTVANLEI
jgi:hypothetical protein